MRRLVPLLLLLLALPAAAAVQGPPQAGPAALCTQAIRVAEQAHGIPAGLLAAMGRVESGRPRAGTAVLLPWPWTIDVAGQGAFFDTEAEAIAAVHSAQARGAQSIDVGCLQVNLHHHPHAFASLTQAFDPASNADYAARLLRTLFIQTGSWPQAVALYHSATPARGAAYRRQVMAAWSGQTRPALSGPSLFAAAFPGGLPRILPPPVRQAVAARIPPGWQLTPRLPTVATASRVPACPFAALVGCNRIHAKAIR